MRKQLIIGPIIALFCAWGIYFLSDEPYRKLEIPISPTDTSQAATISIDLESLPISNFSDLVEEIFYLSLEEMEHSKVIRMADVIIDDDHILVVDDEGQKVVGFDHQGKYLFDIYRKGKGDEQYRYMEYATYDHERKEVLIVDTWKYIWFDLKGKYLRSYKSEYNFSDKIALLENSNLAYFREFGAIDRSLSPASVNILDSTGQLTSRFLPTTKDKISYAATLMNGKPITGRYPSILITPSYSDKIYQLSSTKEFRLKYKVDFGPHQIPRHYRHAVLTNTELTFGEVRRFEKDNSWARLVGSVMETDRLICVPFFYEGRAFQAYYSKQTGLTRYVETGSINQQGELRVYHQETYNDYLVSWVKPEDLRKALENNKVKDPETIEFIKRLDNGNNPVIRFVKLRDF
ncbi:MAG: 6-bladed beta-propeller [Roseivirga sp.]|nr:6-bladed beta-propeller [Roseivirga sp.]